MQRLEHRLTCSPHPRAHLLSKFALSAHRTTPVAGRHTPSTVTVTPQSHSPHTEVHLRMKPKDSAPCLSLPLSSAISPTPPHRAMPAFASTRRPTACMVTHFPLRRASLPVLIKWPPQPIIRVPSLARRPVGL